MAAAAAAAAGAAADDGLENTCVRFSFSKRCQI